MTLSELQSQTRALTNTDSIGYPDAELNLNLTNGARLLTSELIRTMSDWNFQGDTAYDNLVANKRDYDFPTNFLKIKRLDLKLDGVNWHRAKYIDEGEISESISSETDITNNFSNTEPYYTIRGNKIVIYSGTIKNVTNGIRYIIDKDVVGKDASGNDITSFSNSDDTPNIPTPFQMGICYYAAKMYFLKYGMSNKAVLMDNELEKIISRMNAFTITNEKLYMKPASKLENYE